MWKLLLLAGAGGFIGTCCRFLVNRLFLLIWHAPFPLATFTINIIGCFFLGLISSLLSKSGFVPNNLNAFLMVGFCGGFTTFSTFSLETFNIGNSGEIFYSLLYVVASVIVGLVSVWFGLIIGK